MEKIRVSAVSYTNTLPFLRGIKSSTSLMGQIELSLDFPSECARKVIADEADIGIVPIAVLAEMPESHIVGDYCIGSNGAVDSVFVFSEKPIERAGTLRLDPQSRTSNGLARILLRHYWKREVEIVAEGPADAHVLIGDRTFGRKNTVPHAYDLGHYWKALTGLPFAYAAWVANKKLPEPFLKAFNEALGEGVSDPAKVVPEIERPLPGFDYRKYLTENLDYRLDAQKREAIGRYLEMLGGITH